MAEDIKPPTPLMQKIITVATTHPTLPIRDISKIAECDHAHTIRTLKKYGIDRQEVEDFKKEMTVDEIAELLKTKEWNVG